MELRKHQRRVRHRHRNASFFRRLRMEPLEDRWLLNASYDFGDAPEPHPVTEQSAAVADADGADELLQFTAGGHVLGFANDSLYVAAGSHALHVEFVGAQDVAPQADKAGEAQQGAAAALGSVSYVGLWEGITLSYDAVADGIAESTYVLDPGADPGQIQLEYNVPVEINDAGELVMSFETGQMKESAPVAWQYIDGHRLPVDVSFHQAGEHHVGFTLGQYNTAYTLTIDPTLTWNTFLGGSGTDYGYAIAIDGSGNVYVGGTSTATWGSPVTAHAGGSDAFAAKLASDGSLVWNTFVGGNGTDDTHAIAVDGSGNVYVGGYSTATWGSPVRAYTGSGDAFAAKLASNGSLTWNTFLGGSGSDDAWGIAVDGSGNVYVGGSGTATWGSPVRAYTSGYDAFAAKLASDGSLAWSTFQGGSGDDFGYGMAVDGSGNAYVAGRSDATWGSPVRAYTFGDDAFAAKLASDGSLAWNSFLGGASYDVGSAVAVDGSGNVYVGGISSATWGSPVNAYTGSSDAFAAKLAANGSLTWNSFLGGSGADNGYAIAVDGSGSVYVGGRSNATWGSPARAYTSGYDAFAAKLASNGSYAWNTFLGGSGTDDGYGMAVDGSGNVYVAGSSSASWGSPARAYTSGYDAFAAKLSPAPDSLGVYDQERFYLDTTGNGTWDKVSGGDTYRDFGINPIRSTATPVIGDWDGDGDDDLGVYNEERFYLDTTGNGVWDKVSGGDTYRDFGINPIRNTAIPVIGDWDGDGDDDLGVYNEECFYLDTTGNGVWDKVSGGDTYRDFGINPIRSTAIPVIGDWDGDGVDDLGVYNNEFFYLDTTGNGTWDKVSGGDTFRDFGINPIRASAIPVIGRWASGSPLLAAGGHATAYGAERLTSDALTPIVEQATAVWAASGLDQEELQRLASVQVLVGDLPGAQLGEASGTTITLDVDAAGYGWFVDATPGANEEFVPQASGSLLADADSSAAERMDLLTAVMHELGHVLGHGDLDDLLANDVMNGWLPAGVRRL